MANDKKILDACCGYTESNINFSGEGLITNVEVKDGYEHDGDYLEITVFHQEQKLAEISMLASSRSGWGYGAISTLLIGTAEITSVEW